MSRLQLPGWESLLSSTEARSRGREVARSLWCRPGGDGVGAGDPAVLGDGAGGAHVAVPRVPPVTLDIL